MVNCILAGNVADSLGGATCNADDAGGGDPPDATTTFNMHNCLLAGNLADTAGNQGGGHLNRDGGESTLINCTVVKNVAFAGSGGIENANGGGTLKVQNCIVWGNDDDAGNGGLDNQLHYGGAAPETNDVDGDVIEFCTFGCFTVGTNKNDDPDVLNTTGGMTWITCSFDADTGISTFNITVNVSTFTNERLFQPDADSPLQLLIESVVDNPSGDDQINCYGNWMDLHTNGTKTGTIFDYHIASGSSAIDFGDTTYLADAADPCDLNGLFGKEEPLPLDLDLNDRREQGSNPDSGAYEIE